jgi:flagellar assembly protein FliH
MPASRVIKNGGGAWSSFPWGQQQAAPGLPARMKHFAPGAPSNLEQLLEEAFLRGRQDGEEITRQRLESELRKAQSEFAEAVVQSAASRKKVYRQAERDLLRLSVAIARRILNRELHVAPDALAGIVSSALRQLEGQTVTEVRVHSTVRDIVEQHIAQTGETARVVGDPSLPRAGCVLSFGRGTIDAGVETQLEEIEKGLADHLEE